MATVGKVLQESFFVGGEYVDTCRGQMMHGQIYVERLMPEKKTHPYPLVFIHGMGQTAMNWITTPDGRPGWGQWFAAQGWEVYLIDQPARGRSACLVDSGEAYVALSTEGIEQFFTAAADFDLWPQAKKHMQWPGDENTGYVGHVGDAVFDQFYASIVPSLPSIKSEPLVKAAGVALLDKIGPSILITHSQAGLFGWLIADARPDLVKAIVAVEPSGPPVRSGDGANQPYRLWGLTDTELTYEPPVTHSSPLQVERKWMSGDADLKACWLQKGPPRQLVNLAEVKVLVVSAEASYHAEYDHCTAHYLSQAGVETEFLRLGENGIHGNGHMMMLEKNSLEIAGFLEKWLLKNINQPMIAD